MMSRILSNHNKLRYILLFSLLLLLTACGKKDYTLHFKEEMVLDFGTNQNTISLIQSIGKVEITDDLITGNTIEIDTFVVTCDEIDTNKLGNYEVVYQTNALEKRFFTKQVSVKDISAPVIKVSDKEITLTLEEYKEYNFADFIEVEDNWKEDQPIIDITIDQVIEVGKSYEVRILAKDKFGNEATEMFTLHIKEEEKTEEVIESPEVIPNNPVYNPPVQNPNGVTNIAPPVINQAPPVSSNPTPSKPQGKDFLFSNGYTIENVGNACQQELLNSGASGSCIPLRDSNGIYIGMRLQFN